MIGLYITGLFFFLMPAHPVHVSVAHINLNPESKRFDISLKLFRDDFEQAVLMNSGKTVDFTSSEEKYRTTAEKYIRDKFQIVLNDNPSSVKKLEFVKFELKEDAVWVYCSYPLKGRVTSLRVENEILLELYKDMTNLVVLQFNELEEGYSLNQHNTTIEYKK
jgi:hypothetical protein